jgi:hypothetical protein
VARRYGHVDETIFTVSTLSRGEDIAAVDVAEPAVARDGPIVAFIKT